MTIAASDLRAAFPEFASTTTYPDAQVTFWLSAAYTQLSAFRFGASLDLAVMLFVAHNIVLSARDVKTTAAGGIAGEATGPVAAKSVVGAGSKAYNTGATTIDGAGPWNATSYGQRLYKMLRAFGSGPLYFPGRRSFFGLSGYLR